MIKVGSDFSGVGAFNQALKRIGIDYEEVFACESNYFARLVFIDNYGTKDDLHLAKSETHKIFCKGISAIQERDFKTLEGVLLKMFSECKTLEEKILDFKNKADDYAKSFSFYFPFDVYDRQIPIKSLDIYMTSPPCQAFSLAGKRKGEDDKRGILFYNSHEFIKKNNPRYFIFENVKGLLSDDNGKTFARWIDMLSGKSVNGNPIIFPHEDSVPYHVYHKVLNAKNYGVPQNRERVFIIGIRDDSDNIFSFPKEIPLTKKLKDILEENVDEKYYLSDNMIEGLTGIDINSVSKTIRVGGRSSKSDKHNWDLIKVGYINQDTQASQVYSEMGISQTLCAGTHGYANGYVKIGAIRGRNPDNPKSRRSGLETVQMLEINENGTSNCLTTVRKDNVVIEQRARGNNKGNIFELSPSITCNSWQENNILHQNHRIRKLTPRECLRLMDFPDDFDFSCVSDSQAYKQAGNSIVVNVLAENIKKLNL